MNNLEFINQATTLLTQDYNIKYTAEYGTWLRNHKNVWSQSHTIIPFPPFIISSDIASFKSVISPPSEAEIVSKALELYNKRNAVNEVSESAMPTEEIVYENLRESVTMLPISETVETVESVDPVVTYDQESVTDTTNSTLTTEPMIEQSILPVSTSYTDEVYKIFQSSTEHVTSSDISDSTVANIETDLGVIPQPIEELSKIAIKEKSRSTVLERLQNMTEKWSRT